VVEYADADYEHVHTASYLPSAADMVRGPADKEQRGLCKCFSTK